MIVAAIAPIAMREGGIAKLRPPRGSLESPAVTHEPDHNPAQQTEAPWTTRRLLTWIGEHMGSKGIESPRLVAEMLLAHVIGCDRMRLYMEVDRPATPSELTSLRELVARAAKHEPVQYLVGNAWFFGREFRVDPSVLIPRPSSETLVEHVLQWRKTPAGHANPVIADIGTGSGCIAITLAAQLSDAHLIATDIWPRALALAEQNAAHHDVADRVEFLTGDGLEPLRERPGGVRVDVICSNPPYISDTEWAEVAPNVRDYEPMTALRGGVDGLDVIGVLIAEAGPLIKPGGKLVVEIAHSQRDAVIEMIGAADLLTDPLVLKDHEDFWRVLVAERPHE